jgi:hypothetical protein
VNTIAVFLAIEENARMATQEQRRRIEQAMAETQAIIDKELRYSEDLQKPEYLAKYRAHLAKLQLMLETGEGLPK